MSATLVDEPTSTRPRSTEIRLDVCGLDYDARRRRLYAALYTLRPGDQLRVISSGALDLYWLRYEMEARDQRYHWSQSVESAGLPAQTVAQLLS